MGFKKATKKAQWLRLCLISPSGGGKTYSALRIATGLLDGDARIGMIDTERGSGELYADLFDYDVMQLGPPFSPDRYIDAMNEAKLENFGCLIVDSGSHCWMGQGGVLEIADKFAANSKNPYGGWSKATPEQNRFLDALLTYPGHIILTLRTKTAYEIQEGANGKKTPIKIGLAPVQRDGMEYEFTTIFDLGVDGNLATSSKDRTRLFMGKPPFLLTEETGRLIRNWLEAGDSREDLFQQLKTDAVGNNDLRQWWVDNLLRIKLLPQEDQDRLVKEIKEDAAARPAASQGTPQHTMPETTASIN